VPLTLDDAIDIAKRTIRADQLARSAIYLLRPPIHGPGTLTFPGDQRIDIVEPSYVLFLDLLAGMNWAHPARYLVIPESNGRARAHTAKFRPARGTTELRFSGSSVETWMLLA
jgi:hypothetical protein